MPYNIDGGDFSPDLFTRLKAMKQGSMSNDDLAQSEAMPQDAINTASGVLGTVQGPGLSALKQLAGQAAEGEGLSWAQRIKQAAQNSAVKQVPTAEDALAEQYANSPKNFFTNAQQKATELGVGASPAEQAAMQAQGQASRDAIKQKIQNQIQGSSQFGNLGKFLR